MTQHFAKSQTFVSWSGIAIRLTKERLEHILERPEMRNLIGCIEETIRNPEIVMQSRTDADVFLVYRKYERTLVGEKYLCVICKQRENDAFIITAYLTDQIKKGERLWERKA